MWLKKKIKGQWKISDFMNYFTMLQHVLTTCFMLVAAVVWGVAAIPSVYIFLCSYEFLESATPMLKVVGISLSLGVGYILWGVSIVLLTGICGFIIRPRLKESKVPLRSLTTIRWGIIGALTRLRYNWMELISPSWVSNIHYKMMGCKIGKNVQINTANLNDAFMVEIGDGAVIGGGASINAHLVEKGELVLAPVIIGSNSVIGAHSLITPGCEIGEGSVVAASAVLSKWTKIPSNEVWGGIPAKFIKKVN